MDSIQRYFELLHKYPSHFTQSEQLPLILEEKKMRQFTIATGQPLGVIYESPYHIFIVDLTFNIEGNNFQFSCFPFLYSGKYTDEERIKQSLHPEIHKTQRYPGEI